MTNEQLAKIREFASSDSSKRGAILRDLLAHIDLLDTRLLGQSVCDCHDWPTIAEMHDYVVALELAVEKEVAPAA